MQFNKFLFHNFKESKYGQELIEFFSDYKTNFLTDTKYQTLDAFTAELCHEGSAQERVDNHIWGCQSLMQNLLLMNYVKNRDLVDFHDFEVVFCRLIKLLDIENNIGMIKPLSHCLYILYPEFCFPYFFDGSHYKLLQIFEDFGIYAPPIPKKNDIYARVYHYIELCESLYSFRQKFGMDKTDLPAFLYGFAPNVITKYELDSTLPKPKRIWLHCVSDKVDMETLDKASSSTIHHWSGNVDTQPGDIIVKYCTRPRSSIHSIWRAITPGFLDPFFYYYKSLYIAHPIHIMPITFNELKKDNIMKEAHFIKMNMQGMNARSINKVYYDRMLEMIAADGTATDNFPKIHDEPEPDIVLKNERDVEIYLLEPLLKRLGYKETDWKRQMKLRMGRGYRVYPDYVIYPIDERNNESGQFVWEAKFSIKNNKQLLEDLGQVKSYAIRLNCKGFGLVSKEGVWFSESMKGFSFQAMEFWSWKQMGEFDFFNVLFNLAGRKRGFND